jgi:ribosome-binding protein aMBF1 (putative translation factor)
LHLPLHLSYYQAQLSNFLQFIRIHESSDKEKAMVKDAPDFSMMVKEVRRQLGISQEALAQELRVSYATINRWENGKTTPFKLARAQFDEFCMRMTQKGKLNL